MTHGDLAQTVALVGAAGSVLVLVPARRVALAAGFALLTVAEAGLAVALIPSSDFDRLSSPLVIAGLLVGALAVVALALGFVRRPDVVPVALLLAAPFRLPVDLGSQHAFLLLPLYGVLAAACLALLVRAARGEVPSVPRLLAVPLAAFVALDAASLVWAKDLEQGSIALTFFVFPFVALAAVVARAPVAPWLGRALAATIVGLACVFAAIGLWQEWTRTVFFAQDLRVANTYASFFRVTSVFKDPSIYGRHLVLAIAVVLVALWLDRVRVAIAVPVVAFLFAGLYFSYSQSSMLVLFAVALATGLLLADRRSRIVLACVAAAAVVAAGAVAVNAALDHSLRRATSGRSTIIKSTLTVIGNHPVAGVGIGSQPLASHTESKTRRAARRDASHTTPLTVAAELGTIGVLLYLAFLAAAARLFRIAIERRRALGLGLATAFLVLLLHSLFYSGFFEDPIMWGALGVAAALAVAPRSHEQPLAD
jgi:putative inorganic carbon (hco3(-)) transporter